VEYVSFNGANYVDMGVDAVGNTKVTVDYKYNVLSAGMVLFGFRTHWNNAQAMWMGIDGGLDGYYYARNGGTATSGTDLFPTAANTSRHTAVADNNVLQIDSLPAQTVGTGAPTESQNLFLGAINTGGSPSLFFDGLVYSASIDKDGTADDRDFVPVRCNQETCTDEINGDTVNFGEYGFYDTLNDKFYKSGVTTEPLSGGTAVGQDAPTITSITPNTGSFLGGNTVVITGTEFGGMSSVTFGGVAATCVANDNTRITCFAPAHAVAEAVDVTVTADGGSVTEFGGFTYAEPRLAIQHYFAANKTGQTLTVDLSSLQNTYGNFQVVEYLTFDGTQYLNMGVNAVGNTKVTVDYQYTSLNTNNADWPLLFGSRREHGYQGMFFGLYGGNGSPNGYVYIRNAENNTQSGGLFTSATNTNRHTVVADNNTVKVDNLATSTTGTGAPTTSYLMYLGAINNAGNTVSNYSKVLVYSAQIDKDSDANDRNFLPVRCNVNPTCVGTTNTGTAATYNEYGMYDTLHQVFYHAGAGTLGGGADVGVTVTGVKVDGVVASFSVGSDNQITVTVPSHAITSASVPVEIVTSGGTVTLSGADGLNFLALTNPTPAKGSSSGGTGVTVLGSGLSGGSLGVKVGLNDASGVMVVDDNTLSFVTPVGVIGVADVVISGLGDGESLTLANAWEYESYLTLSISNNGLVNLSPVPNGGTNANFLTANVKTDHPDGYQLSIESTETDLLCETNTGAKITALSGTGTLTNNHWGYAKDEEPTPTEPTDWTGVATAPTPIKTLATAPDPINGDTTRLWFGAMVDYALPACNYAGTVVITVVGL
jgi:hypothetical protein